MTVDTFNIPTNWATPVSEEISFRTEIITSYDGTEQRIAQRINPRYRYTWSLSASHTSLLALERRLARDVGRVLAFDHPRAATLTARGQPGAAGIPGRFDGPVNLSGASDGVVEASVSVLATPGVYLSVAPDVPDYGAAATVFDGLEVLTVAPNWATPVGVLFDQVIENFDFGRGVTDFFLPQNYTNRIITMEFSVHTLDRENQIVGLYFRCYGRLKDFYLPDPLTTLDPVLDIAGGSTTIVLPGTEAAEAFLDQNIYRNIQIETVSGGKIFRKVVSVAEVAGFTNVEVDTPLPAITAADFISMRWLLRCRFETDLFPLDWITETVAVSTFTVRAVEDF